MEVIYSSQGQEDIHVGVRLPCVGESLESVIREYAPVQTWLNLRVELEQIEPGVSGSIGRIPPVLEEIKTLALENIASYSRGKRCQIAGTTDDAEIAGWNNKLRIALAYQIEAATVADLAAMQTEIDARGLAESMDMFVSKVLKNAAFYTQAVGLIDGLKRRAQDAVSAADSPDAVESVLMQMREQAETAFTNLMATAV